MYQGYLVKIGSTELDFKWINYADYSITPNQRQDLDSFRDNNGYLHRTVLPHTATKIEFNTPPMPESSKMELFGIFENNFTNKQERKLTINYYSPDTSTYKTAEVYMPDVQFQLQTVDEHGQLWYDTMRIAFIEY